MKSFKEFLEEASNAIKSIRDSGFKLKKGGYSDPSLPDGMMRWGWKIKKANITPKMYDPKTDLPYIRTLPVRKNSADKFRKGTGFNLPIPLAKKPKKMNGNDKSKYDKYNNPERPSEADLINGIPIKKA
tara:strand:- start:244 stop:630 length:387 start_codon:yes stop_codon:yes gene_type:complete